MRRVRIFPGRYRTWMLSSRERQDKTEGNMAALSFLDLPKQDPFEAETFAAAEGPFVLHRNVEHFAVPTGVDVRAQSLLT